MTEIGFALQENVPIAPMTTFGIGGPARFFATVENTEQLLSALGYATEKGLPVFVLGGGSNLLVADEGFDGLVIRMASRGIVTVSDDGKTAELTASAGEDWDRFVAYCVEHELAGVECLSGIPGLVGATPIQNVGAYGQEVSQTIVRIEVLDRTDNRVKAIWNSECGFGYRSSIFNTSEKERYVVLSVTFSLERGGKPFVDYRDLAEQFAGREPTLGQVRQAVLQIRRSKSMVIDPADPNSRSAGSFFKNPIVVEDVYRRIAKEFENAPKFRVDDSHVKVPAAWLIERSGFAKGYSRGNAGISANHTLALVNRSGASAAEVRELAEEIREGVRSRFDIVLEAEPNFIGFTRG